MADMEYGSTTSTKAFINLFSKHPFSYSFKVIASTGLNLFLVGGTVDITSHEVLRDGYIREIFFPTGGPWGGLTINNKFTEFMEKLFGSDFIRDFKTKFPEPWLQLMNGFEMSKRTFNTEKKSHLQVQIPLTFYSALQNTAKQPGDISDIIKAHGDQELSFSNGYLKIKHNRAMELFEQTVSEVIGHISELTSDVRFKTPSFILPDNARFKGPRYIILVGGFGECKFLQDAFRAVFSETRKVVIPFEPQLTILKGAVLFGHNPLLIRSRIARYTYGKRVTKRFVEEIHNPSKMKVTAEGTFCTDCFTILLAKGQEVTTGETRSFFSKPLMAGQTEAHMDFYKTQR